MLGVYYLFSNCHGIGTWKVALFTYVKREVIQSLGSPWQAISTGLEYFDGS